VKLFCFDFETFLIQPYLLAPPIVCMSYTIDDGPRQLVHIRSNRCLALLLKALRTTGCMMVAHNAAFEAACIMAQWPGLMELLFAKLDAGKFYCTMSAERLISIGMGDHWKEYGLDDCIERQITAMRRLETKAPNDQTLLAALEAVRLNKGCWWRVRFGELINTPCELWPEEASEYALEDTCVRELYRAQQRTGGKFVHDNVAREEELPNGSVLFCPGQTWANVELYLTSCWGFPTDRVMADALEAETQAKLGLYADELKRVGMLMPKREKGELKFTLKKDPAYTLIVEAYKRLGREPPRTDLTPSGLVKLYKEHLNMTVTFESSNGRKPKVTKRDFKEAIENGIPASALVGNIALDEEACLNARHPLLTAYTYYSQAKGLMNRVRRLQKPLIQASYVNPMETGRTSSRQGDDPDPGQPYMAYGTQIQNMPRAGATVEE
jgi:hypothetical protein